jgi:conjugative transfer signal peptidase TraF
MRGLTLISTAVSVLALAVSGAGFLPVKLAYNGSASAPIGFYWVDDKPVANGDYVLIWMPDSVETLIETRQYLPPIMPLIKRIAAAEGDVVCRLDWQILIDGVTAAVSLSKDKAGRPLPVWQGCVVLSARQIFLLQPHPDSFDSRYFGPVDRSLIIGRAVRLQRPWRKDEQE